MSSHPLARAVEGVQERTVSGALITGGCVLLILSLLTGELSSYFSPALIHHLGVDDGDASIGSRPFHVPDRLPIELSATFAHVKCDDLELSVEAARGLRDAVDRINFREPHPKELRGWSDAAVEEGCTLDGKLRVGKVSAHFSVGLTAAAAPAKPNVIMVQSFLRQATNAGPSKNMTHKVHVFRFGSRSSVTKNAPLDGLVSPDLDGQARYALKVIPTVLDDGWFPQVANQYSLAESYVSAKQLQTDSTAVPGIIFFYDFFPVMVQVKKERTSILEFLVSLCAVVGGCVALASLLDGAVFSTTKVLAGKAD